jgi:hypothetical protein
MGTIIEVQRADYRRLRTESGMTAEDFDRAVKRLMVERWCMITSPGPLMDQQWQDPKDLPGDQWVQAARCIAHPCPSCKGKGEHRSRKQEKHGLPGFKCRRCHGKGFRWAK